jgi:hypothetical protein
MDPFLVSLSIAVATGISTVAGKLIDKGVVEPALEPATDEVKRWVQFGVKGAEKKNALARAILAAIEDASGQQGESLAVKYARRIRLNEIVKPGNEALRDQVTSLVYLAASEDPSFVPDALLDALHLPAKQRPALARFLFYLRRQLSTLSDFHPLLDAAHQQTVEAELKRMASVVEETRHGPALRVRQVEPEWNASRTCAT